MARTTGGEAPTFKLEEQCTFTTTDQACVVTGTGGSVADLPIEAVMTDNWDGTYSHTFTTNGNSSQDTVVTASISAFISGSLFAEYWTNTSRTGERACA